MMLPKGQVFRVIDQLRRKLKLLKSWLIAYILFIVLSTAENNKEKSKGGTQQLLEYLWEDTLKAPVNHPQLWKLLFLW